MAQTAEQQTVQKTDSDQRGTQASDSQSRPAKPQLNFYETLSRNSQTARTTKPATLAQPNMIQAKSDTTSDRPISSAEQRPNKTGMPDALKAGVESLSGHSLDNVRVHYNSPKPAQLEALAYTQGTEIHVASGQEEHLPHEAWHVVQQAQGRVKPTMQMKNRVPFNDDAGLEHEADVMSTKALAERSGRIEHSPYTTTQFKRVERLSASPSALRASTSAGPVQAKTKRKIARHGAFDIGGAKYRLLEGEGCEISIKFKLGTGIPRGTTIAFLQALKTITTHNDKSVTSAQKVGGQEAAEDFGRMDQFKGNPSAYYLDYIDERLVQLINLAGMDKPGYDIRNYQRYQEYSMDPVSEDVFNNFWIKYDNNRLSDLMTVQKETTNDSVKMSEGKRLNAPSLKNAFNLFSSDVDAQIYDMPKDNLRVPTAVGDVSTCLFHTAAVTKVSSGDATVWDIVQWGYNIEMVDEETYQWTLIPMQKVALDEAMLGSALAKMKETTPGFIGPDRLVKPT
jgi:hypothetical protein